MQSWASFTHGVKYSIRIPANESVEQDFAELLTRWLLGALGTLSGSGTLQPGAVTCIVEVCQDAQMGGLAKGSHVLRRWKWSV